jgi:hypothetical protein
MARTNGIVLSGPFFERDPRKTFRQNIRDFMDKVAATGEADVKAHYPVGPTGDGRAGVVGRTSSLAGKRWAVTAVISETHVYPWKNGGPKQYRGGKTEARVHMFRNARSDLLRLRSQMQADLMKGIG